MALPPPPLSVRSLLFTSIYQLPLPPHLHTPPLSFGLYQTKDPVLTKRLNGDDLLGPEGSDVHSRHAWILSPPAAAGLSGYS